jgi:membrane protein DedA with SNARE-associated domain
MRVIAALLAGALNMPWRKFTVFNLLGAAVWVSAICGAGYLFGGHWGRLARDLKRLDLALLIAILLAALLIWRRNGKPQKSV